jgi:hypothetical protein
MKILFGIWFSLSILMNSFGVWIGRIWNDSNPLWVFGFPLLALVVVGCVMIGAIKERSYLLVLGMAAYALLWVLLLVDKWRGPILAISMANLVLIGFVALKMGLLKGGTRLMSNP